MSEMIRTLFMGTPEFAVPALQALHAGERALQTRFEVVGVATQPDRPSGRGNKMSMSPVKQKALEAGIPVMQPASLRKDASAVDAIRVLHPDLLVVAAYGLILPPSVLAIPRLGSVNIHASLLPAYRGASPITAAILDGLDETGVSIMLMDAGMDTGPVLAQERLPILPEDTTASLSLRLAELGAETLLPVLDKYVRNAIAPIPQEQLPGEPTIVRMIRKEAGRIDWSLPAVQIERMTRAYQPWPTAYTEWRGEPLRILRTHVAEGGDGETGEVIKRDGQIGVVTGDGVLMLDVVQPAGKRPMEAKAFVNGANGFVGAVLPA